MAGIAEIERALAAGPVIAHGAPPAYAGFAIAELARTGPVIAVVADAARAAALADDVRWYGDLPAAAPATATPEPPYDGASVRPSGRSDVVVLPGLDASPYAELSVDRALVVDRLAALYRLATAEPPRVVIASAAGLVRRTLPRAELAARGLTIARGDMISRERLIDVLIAGGWDRVPMVDDPGSFAVRGGVVDLYPPLAAHPVRIELFGDEVETLRWFDAESQRTIRDADPIAIHPVRETIPTGTGEPRTRIRAAADELLFPSRTTRQLIEQLEAGEPVAGVEGLVPAFHDALDPPSAYVPAGATWVVVDPDAVRRAADDLWQEAEARFAERKAANRFAYPPAAHMVSPAELDATLAAPRRRVALPTLARLGDDAGATAVRLEVDDQAALRRELEHARATGTDDAGPLVAALRALHRDRLAIVIGADGHGRLDRLEGLLAGRDVPVRRAGVAARTPDAVTLAAGEPAHGFTSVADGIAVISAGDVFGTRAHARKPARKGKDLLLGGVGDFSQLAVGDYLVHQRHGVGRFLGLKKLPYGQPAPPQVDPTDPTRLLPLEPVPEIDCLQLEYDDGTLYLPVFRLGEVQRYVGADATAPRLDKLGGVTWEKTRRKVSIAVQALAEELLQLYAQRAALPGHRFPPADDDYDELVARFPFEETPDQQAAIDAVIGDMEAPRAMDRLVCGDVGYGKTEVALRAVFRAAAGGKQAVLLAPTTVLVEQHVRTLTERFAGFPVIVGKLSRFQTKAEQLDVVRRLADGTVDVVVGTHRLLSPDVRFKDLGLIVVDEEQRFGVAHKEKLKKLRAHVDALTLTATPIPRTLHLALTGLRDLSIIATPPADRRAVRTLVAEVDDAVIKRAIEHELGRQGQVFFITPTIGSRGERKGAGKTASADEAHDLGRLDERDKTIHEWADHLAALAPTARIGVAHGQLPEAELEAVMVAFVTGALDILVSTTIVESGLDIPRANTMLVARADAFGLAQLYQLRGRIGRSKERAFCYLLVPPTRKLTHEARRRLEVLQRFTELGAGFQIASQDLEIRGGGELLGAKQHGSIAAVGFDTYVKMLESSVGALRGEPVHDPIDPELTVDTPGFIPDDYVPDPSQRLDLYKRLSSAQGDDELGAIVDELADRFGPVPGEVLRLVELMAVKDVARRLGAQVLEITRTRVALGLLPEAPIAPAALAKQPGWRLLPDGRVAHGLDEPGGAPAARRVLLDSLARAT
jgi:transcription-repair coupling factor (superfamily II helicase)